MLFAALMAGTPASAQDLARREFQNLEEWALSPEVLGMPLHEVEAEQLKRSREVNRLLLQAHINARGDGDVGRSLQTVVNEGDGPEQPPETLEFRKGRLHQRRQQTVFGAVNVERRAYSREGHPSFHPLDAAMALPNRSFSYEVQRRLLKTAVQGPFEEAVAAGRELTGLPLPKRSAEDIVLDASADFDDFYEQRPVDGYSGTILVGAVDCKGIPMKKTQPAKRNPRKRGKKKNKKRMATVAAVYGHQPRVRTPEEVTESLFRPLHVVPDVKQSGRSRPQNKRVWASLPKGKDAVIREVRDEMRRRDSDGIKDHVALTDGERALQRRVLKWMPSITLILDLFHVLERLWKAANVFHAEGSDEAKAYVKSRTLMVLQGKVSHVVRGMRQSATKRGLKGTHRKAIDDVTKYLYNNRDYMRYDEYLSKGYPIASGAVEGACKNLVKDRMERSGMRWCELGAEAMLKMRAVYLSGDFDAYWTFHVAQEQHRLRPKAVELRGSA